MNYPIWETLTIGGPTLIAVMAVIHVYVAHLAVGGGLYIWLTDLKGYREERPEIHAYLKKYMVFFVLLTTVFGAVTGVGIWFVIALVSPAATTTLIHTFVFGWAIEYVFFVGEIAAVLVYYYYFDRLGRKYRLRLAALYFIFAWLSLFVINGIIDFMLTPGGWIESRNFWDGFFNPTYWPALFFRTFIALMFAGLFGYVTTVFLEKPEFRRRMVHYCTRWLLWPMLGLVPSALWYYYAVPETFRAVNFGMNPGGPVSINVLIVTTGLIFLLGVLMSASRGMGLQKAASIIIIPIGLLWMGGFEYSREIARKPYVIAHYMYSNSILTGDVELLNREGVLKHARWTTVKEVTDQNRLEAGRELFNLQCLACHTVGGVRNDILSRTRNYGYDGLVAQLTGQGKVLGYMPPFIGTRAEKEALAAFIHVELQGRELPPAAYTGQTAMGGKTGGPEAEIPPFDPRNDKYVLLVWNDLGMHCMSDCDEMFSFLPPANTLEAQLIERGPRPRIVTSGVEISFRVEDGHLNPSQHVPFWGYSEENYGVALEPGQGLFGKGIEGNFDFVPGEDMYRARGIPVVPYRDDGTYNPYPLVHVAARDSGNGQVLVRTSVVAPVSTEADCWRCHGGEPRWEGVAGISTETAGNILKAHDRLSGTDLYREALAGRPQLCQSCHADPALEAEGKPGLLNLSASIHGWHAPYMAGMDDRSCSYCHPIAFEGLTRCLRGVHGEAGVEMHCSRCHGTLEDLSLSLLKAESAKPGASRLMGVIGPRMADSLGAVTGRTPWIENPDCFACHRDFQPPAEGATAFNKYNEAPEYLYRTYHDNAYIKCIACHGSTHAIYPAKNPHDSLRDVIQPMQYQGTPHAIGANMACAVCHTQEMDFPLHHDNMLREARVKVDLGNSSE